MCSRESRYIFQLPRQSCTLAGSLTTYVSFRDSMKLSVSALLRTCSSPGYSKTSSTVSQHSLPVLTTVSHFSFNSPKCVIPGSIDSRALTLNCLCLFWSLSKMSPMRTRSFPPSWGRRIATLL